MRWIILPVVLAVIGVTGVVFVPRGKATNAATAPIYIASRQDLSITVLESGSVKALKSKEIKCEVEGQTTVLSLIPEGTFITEEDVKNERVLVELNSSDLRDKITQEEITLQSTQASYTQAKESYDIQVKQNESNIKAGELNVKFAKMDLEKYVGSTLAAKVTQSPNVDYEALAADKALEGEALQQLRKLQSDIDLAAEEVERASTQYDSTFKLHEREFVSTTELKADELALKRQKIAYEQSQAAQMIFRKYEFPKQVELGIANYTEAIKELERIEARARSELAKAEADLKSSEAALRLKQERFQRLQEQLAACLIKATTPGLVVYGTSDNPWQRQPPLEEGSTVREKQIMLMLPDTSAMAVEVKIYEAVIDKVQVGQKAKVTLDAYPDLQFEGRVVKVAMLPDAQHRWMNPDLKVYNTDVAIEGTHRLLKPGLSAKVEIIIDELQDVVAVPVQSVVPKGDDRVAYVWNNGQREVRVVQTGQASDKFIEISSGINPGDRVLLNPPSYGDEAAHDDAAGEPREGEGGDSKEEGKAESAREQEQQQPPAPDEQGPQVSADRRDGAEGENAGEQGRRFQNMSSEERERIRKEFESLPAEERQKRTEEMRRRRASNENPPANTRRSE